MSFNKAIKHGKEHRKPYTGSKSIDRTCRNHGSCSWCEKNRKHKMRDKHPQESDDNWFYANGECITYNTINARGN